MNDRKIHSWWQPAMGKGIVGDYASVKLSQRPVWIQDSARFRAKHPEGLIMETPDWQREEWSKPLCFL